MGTLVVKLWSNSNLAGVYQKLFKVSIPFIPIILLP